MKRFFLLIFSLLLLFSCTKETQEEPQSPKKIDFIYSRAYSGDLTYPDGKRLYFTCSFGKDGTFLFRVNTITIKDRDLLKFVSGTYDFKTISNGVFDIHFSDKATVGYGRLDIITMEEVPDLSTIFPTEYRLVLTRTGRLLQVNLTSTKDICGYSVKATLFAD